jgi:hypothetical protein
MRNYAITGTGTAHPSGTPEYTTIFSGVRVSRSFVLWCFVDRCLSFYHYFLLFIVLAASSLCELRLLLLNKEGWAVPVPVIASVVLV